MTGSYAQVDARYVIDPVWGAQWENSPDFGKRCVLASPGKVGIGVGDAWQGCWPGTQAAAAPHRRAQPAVLSPTLAACACKPQCVLPLLAH